MFDSIFAIAFDDFATWDWERIAPLYALLEAAPLNDDNAVEWLNARARVNYLLSERAARLQVAVTLDTADAAREATYMEFLQHIVEPAQPADQRLKEKLLKAEVQPPGFETVMRNLQADASLFREANVPLQTEEAQLTNEYARIAGGQTVQWDGAELTLPQITPLLLGTDPAVRERAWRARADRQLADRAAFNELWVRLFTLRQTIARNADKPDYRAYKWHEYHRFDYTPDDCARFQDAIEAEVVPAVAILRERRRAALGTPTLRPWDTEVDPHNRAPLAPYQTADELVARSTTIFSQVDPALGAQFTDMQVSGLLDLDNRKGKAPGAYCTDYSVLRKPFIFMNAVGLHDDVQTLLHEAGHAFHSYAHHDLEEYRRPYAPIEFAEVASMSMELLAGPYLEAARGGFYTPQDAARARIEHLERNLMFWPYMAVVDAFQNWAYTHPDAAIDPAACDAQWGQLWDRFMVGIDYSGLEDVKVTGWHRKLHIFQIPFYYVEYGIAQVGAMQIWINSQDNQADAVTAYRRALALGGTEPLPKLFEAASVRFAMDRAMLKRETDAAMQAIDALSAQM